LPVCGEFNGGAQYRERFRQADVRNVIAPGHPRLPRAQSRPNVNIGQVRIGLNSLCHAAAPQGDCNPRLRPSLKCRAGQPSMAVNEALAERTLILNMSKASERIST
jgi:hypothetical protein